MVPVGDRLRREAESPILIPIHPVHPQTKITQVYMVVG